MEREAGFYWVDWAENGGEPFIALHVHYEMAPGDPEPPRPRWWEVAGMEETFDDEHFVILSGKLVKP